MTYGTKPDRDILAFFKTNGFIWGGRKPCLCHLLIKEMGKEEFSCRYYLANIIYFRIEIIN